MKNLIILCLCILTTSCEPQFKQEDREIATLLQSYIPQYFGGPITLKSAVRPGDRILINLQIQEWEGIKIVYEAPELGSKGLRADKFLEIARRNADRTYNREEPKNLYSWRACYMDNFREVNIICTNAAWDDDHPARSSLNDLTTLHFYTCAEYIRNGYTGAEYKSVSKRLTELTDQDFAMFLVDTEGGGHYLSIEKFPPPGYYEIKVTLVTTEGKEQDAYCSVDYRK